jgi:23S rRNA (cytosine1962-C5)-methyltransferase
MASDAQQREYFERRLIKRFKLLSKWASRNEISCYRLYDKDIPEIPLAIDYYDGAWVMQLYERPYEKEWEAERAWLSEMKAACEKILASPEGYVKVRSRQKGLRQYEKMEAAGVWKIVREGGLRFRVNLSEYLDTGLFLDHRMTRSLVKAQSYGKRVLNLFCYTGSFSVYSAAGGATTIDSVDLSNTYLGWAQENFALNGFDEPTRYRFIKSDVRAFLEAARSRGDAWDLIVVDPPTFSNSSMAPRSFDVNRDWLELMESCLLVAAAGAKLLFSTNSRAIRFDATALERRFTGIRIRDTGDSTVPPDFRNRKIHRLWEIDA